MTKEEFFLKFKNEKEINHVMDFLNKSKYKNKNINFNYYEALMKANNWVQFINRENNNLQESGRVETIISFGELTPS